LNNNYGRRQKLVNLEQATDWDGFEFVPVDLARGDLFERVAESEVIFRLAAEPGVRASWGQRFDAYVWNNIVASQHLLDAATHDRRALLYLDVERGDVRNTAADTSRAASMIGYAPTTRLGSTRLYPGRMSASGVRPCTF
jgi:dTDP-D-glucose 4,6-dehydratase